jgi:hypothetical protein
VKAVKTIKLKKMGTGTRQPPRALQMLVQLNKLIGVDTQIEMTARLLTCMHTDITLALIFSCLCSHNVRSSR